MYLFSQRKRGTSECVDTLQSFQRKLLMLSKRLFRSYIS